mmetsp:Transcript_8938/g.14609  ORF Transcript_8938/g.14609 Transcript_8938/m.14609 type:complete len:93 (-) Transcript_8938:681-959(-)
MPVVPTGYYAALASNEELVGEPTQKAALQLVWIVDMRHEEAGKIQEQQKVHNVADCRKRLTRSNSESRDQILHDVERHQKGKEECGLGLYAT